MKYEIWQLAPSHPNKFMWLEMCKKEVDIRDYVLVYSDETDGEIKSTDRLLEALFYTFNQDCPVGYHAASMSVSDLICFINDNNKRTWWYVDGIGFKEVEI